VGVVEEPIADGVGQPGLAEVIVPLGRWQLAGDSVESGKPAPSGFFVCFPLALGLLSQGSNDFNID